MIMDYEGLKYWRGFQMITYYEILKGVFKWLRMITMEEGILLIRKPVIT